MGLPLLVRSIMDTDAYKVSMGQVIFNQFPNAIVEYEFINRGGTKFPTGFAPALSDQIHMMQELRACPEEFDYYGKRSPYLKPTYLEWLAGYRFNPNEVAIDQFGGDLRLKIAARWYRGVHWEVSLMGLISELYFKMTDQPPLGDWIGKMVAKRDALVEAGCHWADFGTRRRHSYEVQNALVATMKGSPGFGGTSNPHLAYVHDLTPIGTYAHEAIMAMQAGYGHLNCNRMWMDAWVREYQGNLGIALPDTVTSDYFFNHQFDMFYSKLFDGVRQDSGDPCVFAEKVIAHYKSLGIDPKSKRLVFSDGLDPDKLIDLQKHFGNRIMVQGGIGTNFTNDVGRKPLNMVIKMTKCDLHGTGVMRPVVKLSDDPGKHTGNKNEIAVCKQQLGIA